MGVSSHVFIILEWCLVAACLVVVVTRLAVRSWKRVWSFWLSEIFLGISLLFFIILVIGDTYTFSLGFNAFEEFYDVGFAKWKFASSIVFDMGFYFPRFSLLAFYNELFPISEPKMRIFLYIVAVYTLCAFLTATSVDIFWCGSDISQNWSDSDSACVLDNTPEPTYINWSIGISSELLVFTLPFGILRRLKALGKRERIGLTCIFMLGIATLLVSVARFVLSVQSIFSYDTYLIGDMEIATQIFVVALPALRPLVSRVRSSRAVSYVYKRSTNDSSRSQGPRKSNPRSSAAVSVQLSNRESVGHIGEAISTEGATRVELREPFQNDTEALWEATDLP